MNRYRIVALAICVQVGCLEVASQPCGSLICPAGTACSSELERCVDPSQIDACSSVGDGEICSYDEVEGVCDRGVCIAQTCGDGIVTAPEQCEPGELGGLTCAQLGFYEADGLTCNADCTANVEDCVGRCGDQLVNGPELCDTLPGDSLTCTEIGFDYGSVRCGTNICAPLYDDCVRLGVITRTHPNGYYTEASVLDDGTTYLAGSGNFYVRISRLSQETIPLPQCGNAKIWASETAVFLSCGEGDLIKSDGQGTLVTYPSPIASFFPRAMWGRNDNDVYSVGDFVSHFDGETLTEVTDPALVGTSFNAIDGNENIVALIGGSTLATYDGTSWTKETLPASNLTSVWVSPSDKVYVTGDGDMWRRSGTTWVSSRPPNASQVNQVAGLGETVYAIDANGRFRIWQFDSTRWIELDHETNNSFGGRVFHSNNHIMMVEPYNEFFDTSGYGFTPQPSPPAVDLDAVWVFAPDNALAVGGGTELRWDGVSWNATALPAGIDAVGLFAASPNAVTIIGDTGIVLRGAPGSLTNDPVAGAVADELFEVAGTAADNVFIRARLSSTQKILHSSGAGWTEVLTGEAGLQPVRLWAHPARGTYVVAGTGVNLQYKLLHNPLGAPPTQWTQTELSEPGVPVGIWGDESQLIVYYSGGNAIMLGEDDTWSDADLNFPASPTQVSGTAADLFGISGASLIHRSELGWDSVRLPANFSGEPLAVFSGNGATAIVGTQGLARLFIRR